MIRPLAPAMLVALLVSGSAFGQDGPLRRMGRALDNTGKNIRDRVETEVVRGQITAQERDVLNRVSRRIEWDKPLVGSALQLEVQPGGSVIVRGSVRDEAAKLRAVDLVENTIGVTRVVDEIAVVKVVKVIESKPIPRALDVPEPIVVPSETKVIVKP